MLQIGEIIKTHKLQNEYMMSLNFVVKTDSSFEIFIDNVAYKCHFNSIIYKKNCRFAIIAIENEYMNMSLVQKPVYTIPENIQDPENVLKLTLISYVGKDIYIKDGESLEKYGVIEDISNYGSGDCIKVEIQNEDYKKENISIIHPDWINLENNFQDNKDGIIYLEKNTLF